VTTCAKNHWLDDDCARSFWDQHKAIPYQELLRDTGRLLETRPGEHWLDLGCGCGKLTALLWQRSGGQLAGVTALDCAAVNAAALDRVRRHLTPQARTEQIRFVQGNFSDGLGQFADASCDGVVSGLALSYAESRDPETGRYTDVAYNRILAEILRVLKPGGRFVFSVNVPRPRFWRIFWKSLGNAFRLSKPGRVLINGLRMQRYGRWLRREAEEGRFHFLPLPEIIARLQKTGFEGITAQISYAGQAYLLSARKSAALARAG
jgi:ubiquinone/menaquinone biosynthesis C-methylase UbiE